MCNSEFVDDVNSILDMLTNVVAYRFSIVYVDNNSYDADTSELLNNDNYIKKFIDFAQLKLPYSPALMDELARFEGV